MALLWSGTLTRMQVEASDPVAYALQDALPGPEGTPIQPLNGLIGRLVSLRFTGEIRCVACGIVSERVYDNGYCQSCFHTRADADFCMMRPELCHHGDPDKPCRDEVYAQERCFQPHYLYAALTHDVKVGITRHTNVPMRWLNQGAVAAITLAELPSRRAVGLVEHALAQHVRDRTHWMRMLRAQPDEALLDAAVPEIEALFESLNLPGLLPPERRIRARFRYPITTLPEKIRSLSLDRATALEGTLLGMKGQYWILDSGVIHVGRHSGYGVRLYVDEAAPGV